MNPIDIYLPSSQLFLADGTVNGIITISSTLGYSINTRIVIFSSVKPLINLEVKKVISNTQIAIGPITDSPVEDDIRADVSEYKVADTARIAFRGTFQDVRGNYVTTYVTENSKALDVNVVNSQQEVNVEWLLNTQFNAGTKTNVVVIGTNENAHIELTAAPNNNDNIPFSNAGDYTFDASKLEIVGGRIQLKQTPAVLGLGNFDYNNALQYIYDPTKIDVSGGVAKLFYTLVITGFGNFDYNTPAQYSYDPAKIEMVGGVAKLVLQPATQIHFVDWNYNISADYTFNAAKVGVSGGVAYPLPGAFCYAHWLLNEVVGSAVADSSGNGRNGVASGSPIWVAGKINNCLRLNGASQYVNCGNIASFEKTDSFSVECWFKHSATGFKGILEKALSGTPYTGWSLYISGTQVLFSLVGNATNAITVYPVTPALNDGVWHHVIVTYNGSSDAGGVLFYVDGILRTNVVSTNNLTLSILNTQTCNIGKFRTYYFIGDLDEVVIYDRILSSSEAIYRYNAGNGTEALTSYVVITPKVGLTSGVPITTWDNYIETATKSTGDEIRYILSDNDGATWKYWNGVAWVTSDTTYDQATTAAVIQSNFNAFPKVNNKLLQRAFFHSGGTDPAMSLDLVQIDYSPTAKYDTTNPTVIANYNVSDSPLIQFNLLTETSTKPSGTNLQYTLSADDGVTWLYWSGSAWAISDGTYAQSNDVVTINAHITNFPVTNQKIRVKAFLNSDGGNTPLLDNIKVDYSKYLTHYPTDNPTIDANYNVSDSPLVQWSAYTETATKPSNTNIKYTLSNDNGITWYYWNGSTWTASSGAYSQANTVSEIQANFSTFPVTNQKIRIRAFLNNTADTTPQLDNVKVDYIKSFAFYPTDENLSITTKDSSHVDPLVVLNWISSLFTYTQPALTDIKAFISVDGRSTWLKWSGGSWVTTLLPALMADASSIADIQNYFSSLPLGNGTLDVRLFLNTTNALVTPQVDNINIVSFTGYFTNGSWETQVYNSNYLENDWLNTIFNFVAPIGTTINVKYRTANYTADLILLPYSSPIVNGEDLLNSGKYIQFKVEFSGNGQLTPLFNSLLTKYRIYSISTVRP